jgi:hypothetical protein
MLVEAAIQTATIQAVVLARAVWSVEAQAAQMRNLSRSITLSRDTLSYINDISGYLI